MAYVRQGFSRRWCFSILSPNTIIPISPLDGGYTPLNLSTVSMGPTFFLRLTSIVGSIFSLPSHSQTASYEQPLWTIYRKTGHYFMILNKCSTTNGIDLLIEPGLTPLLLQLDDQDRCADEIGSFLCPNLHNLPQ